MLREIGCRRSATAEIPTAVRNDGGCKKPEGKESKTVPGGVVGGDDKARAMSFPRRTGRAGPDRKGVVFEAAASSRFRYPGFLFSHIMETRKIVRKQWVTS